MKKYLLIIYILISYLTVFAQSDTISGFLKDSKNKEPLIAAEVYNINKKSGTFTEFDGGFKIVADTNDLIKLSYFGYKTIIVQANNILLKNEIFLVDSIKSHRTLGGPFNSYKIGYIYNNIFPLGFNFEYSRSSHSCYHGYTTKYYGVEIKYQTNMVKNKNIELDNEYYCRNLDGYFFLINQYKTFQNIQFNSKLLYKQDINPNKDSVTYNNKFKYYHPIIGISNRTNLINNKNYIGFVGGIEITYNLVFYNLYPSRQLYLRFSSTIERIEKENEYYFNLNLTNMNMFNNFLRRITLNLNFNKFINYKEVNIGLAYFI